MQSYDEQQRMIGTKILDLEGERRIKQIQEELDKKEVANIVVGKLPTKDQEITINGLIFVVKFVDYKRGTIQLRIKKYKEDTEDENGITHEIGEIAKGDL